MAKKRHWKKRAKLSATENAKVKENGGNKGLNSQNISDIVKDSMQNRKDVPDDQLLCTKEVSGETCLDIDCGSNKALLYLSKMCLGSKGACILFKGSWLTPNEFQFVSGRENAKDWKRSIRHNGSSLKLLLAKNLIKIQTSPKKSDRSEEKENNEKLPSKLASTETKPVTEIDAKSCTTSLTAENDSDLSVKESEAEELTDSTGAAAESNIDDRRDGVTETVLAAEEVLSDKETDLAKTEEEKTEPRVEDQSVIESPKDISEPVPVLEPESRSESEKQSIVELAADPCLEPETSSTTEPNIEPKITDPGHEPKTELEVDTQAVDETIEEALPGRVCVKRVRRRKKKGTKRGWARQKSRTTSQGQRSRQSSPALDDLPIEEQPCAYESLTEEDKLSVFVKALRLARKRDLPDSVSNIPEQLSSSDQLKSSSELEEREMPVLEREIDLVVPNPLAEPSHPNMFPSTVTPPPTPPLTESPDLDEIKREFKTIDQNVFESRLSPVEEGIKLKINRLFDDSTKDKECKPGTDKQEIKSATFQNNSALTKEQTCSSGQNLLSVKSEQKPVNSVSDKIFTQLPPEVVVATTIPLNDNVRTHVPEDRKPERKSLPEIPRHTAAISYQSDPKVGASPMTATVKQECLPASGISMVQTPYGPMVMPTEDNLRLYHEFLAAYSMMHHSLTQPHSSEKSPKPRVSSGNSTSAAALSAKTAYQQGKSALFEGANFNSRTSSVNIPRTVSVNTNSQRTNVQNVKYENTERKVINAKATNFDIAKATNYDYMKNGMIAHVPKFETMERKRKYLECESALDLTVKKSKVDSAVAKVPPQYNYVVEPQDSPLDFSVKKTTCNDTLRHVTNTKTVTTASKQNFVSSMQRNDNVKMDQYRANTPSHSLQNKMSAQTDKYSSIPNNTNLHNKSGYNSLWHCVTRQLDKDMSKWTVEHVCLFLGCLDGCGDYMQVFRDQGINGKILPFLTTQHLTRTLGMKVGPALALQYAIGRFFKDSANPNSLSSRPRVSV